MTNRFRSTVNNIYNIVNQSIKDSIEQITPVLKDSIMGSYEDMLCGVVESSTDDIKPETYKQLFYDKLQSFNFIRETDKGINLVCPDVDNIDFEGMEYLYSLLNGLVGTHYKVSSDMIGGDGKNTLVINEDNPILNSVNKESLPMFEFSNTRPINIFSNAELFISKNLKSAVDYGTNIAKIKIQEYYEGSHDNHQQD